MILKSAQLGVVLLAVVSLFGFWQVAHGEEPEVLTNSSIIKMVQELHMSDTAIISMMGSNKCAFDMSLSKGLPELKARGVSDVLIQAMVETMKATKAEAKAEAAPVAAEADPNDPAAPHDPGVYLAENRDGKMALTELDGSVYGQAKSKGGFGAALSGGLSHVKMVAVLNGATASTQIESTKPTFYFYFEEGAKGLSQTAMPGSFSGATSPNEFYLIKAEVKGNGRQIALASANAFSQSSGADEKTVQSFDYEKIAKHAYKVVPKTDLEAGEYYFMHASVGMSGGTGGGKVFDFGVKGAAKAKH